MSGAVATETCLQWLACVGMLCVSCWPDSCYVLCCAVCFGGYELSDLLQYVCMCL